MCVCGGGGVGQDGRVMVESSDRMWSTGEANGKPLQYSCLENPMNSMKRQKHRTLKDEFPNVHSSFITNHPRLETTPVLINNILQKDLEVAPGR